LKRDYAPASRVAPEGEATIEVTSIDAVLNGEKASLIKMDVEGSELNSLKGAVNTIKAHRPILAVCVYHKPMDIIDIPLYLRETAPDYSFFLRMYHSFDEIVLYAIPPERCICNGKA
jgi:hypothetical protein